MEMHRLGRQKVTAMVLSAKVTKNEERVTFEMQVIGGGVERICPTVADAKAAGLKLNAMVDLDASFVVCGSAEEKRGEFTDRFSTYKLRLFLPEQEAKKAA